MTRLSKRELERKVEDLEYRDEPHTDAALFVAPDSSVPDDRLPDVDTSGIRVRDPESGRREVVVPYHRPDQWWRRRIPVVAESHVAAVWWNMSEEQLARERRVREEQGDPIPPILEGRAA